MKTILRIHPRSVDTSDPSAAGVAMPMLAVRMLTEFHAHRRAELAGDAQLVVDRGSDGRPVYLTIGERPPELVIGDRKVLGVFSPPDSQEPVATFLSLSAAEAWAAGQKLPSRVAEIDATDRESVKVAVAALMVHNGKVLLGKLKDSGIYVLPEGGVQVGESLESAVKRAVKLTTGLELGRIAVSAPAPYVNTFLDRARQHFITLCMAVEYVGGEPIAVDKTWESCGWFDAEDPPKPLFVTVQQIMYLARRSARTVASEPAPITPTPTPVPKAGPRGAAKKTKASRPTAGATSRPASRRPSRHPRR